ncbi:hypothetical protein AMELA_G00053780 [Ameiurus melas]|uniref:BTB domain-containing protein n=1 Tax=Ameiurus melas TaxID=219545 RepID=A0A7J6B8Y7_AMEME|nr:hypothetical protein AMELA_G00053780 [Ameiurus melas]
MRERSEDMTLWDVLNEMRLEEELCDVILRVDEVEFKVHKIILCANSPYFRSLFMRWSSSDQTVYTMMDVSPDIMAIIIHYIYTQEIRVTTENVRLAMIDLEYFLENIKTHPLVSSSWECQPIIIRTMKAMFYINKIYICGGFNGNDYLFTAECFDPRYDQWTQIERMHVRRSGVGVVALNDRVSAIGGFDGAQRLQCVEAYNPRTNSWRMLASMFNPRSNFGVEVMDGRLYVVGGYVSEETTSNCEYYDEESNDWYETYIVIRSRNLLFWSQDIYRNQDIKVSLKS